MDYLQVLQEFLLFKKIEDGIIQDFLNYGSFRST